MRPASHLRRHLGRLAVAAYGCAALLLLGTCTNTSTQLERVREAGVLKVASVYGRTTCYSGPDGLQGFECDLAQSFAKNLGVNAEISFSHSPAEALQAVLDGKADLAAAGLTLNPERQDRARFTAPVDRVVAQVVFRMGAVRPKSPADLNGRLLVSEGEGHAARLAALATTFPNLKWETTNAYDSEDLLTQVATGLLDYTVASSALVAINQRYYPRLRIAFDLGEPEDVVLALPPGPDSSLFDAAQNWLRRVSGKDLARLHDRYYGHVEEVDYFGAVQIATHLRSRLPRYRAMFEKSAQQHGLDWRLLAAIGYQESHWDAGALSYTGVRGLMMLTGDTAARFRISNREDPAQSIEGGARVLAEIFDKLPAGIPEPDRSWMALAAYNQGLGHVLDARDLVKSRGGDPNRWLDLRDAFPLLSRPRWHEKSKYGYTRGREAVDFVGNVRAYYDILSWLTSGVPIPPPPPLRLDPKLHLVKDAEFETRSLSREQIIDLPTAEQAPADAVPAAVDPALEAASSAEPKAN